MISQHSVYHGKPWNLVYGLVVSYKMVELVFSSAMFESGKNTMVENTNRGFFLIRVKELTNG
jgi:hypothetical protein